MPKFCRELVILAAFVFSPALWSQVSSVSPYSRIGLGSIQTQNYTRSIGFGGANLALGDAFYVNATNPASYSQLQFTSLEIGFFNNLVIQEQSNPDIRLENSNAGLRYFTVAVPLKDWWGSAIGLQPLSTRGYDIVANRIGPDSIMVEDRFVGSGSLNRFYWGNGFKILPNLRVGVNAAFIFGQLEDQNILIWDGNINNSVFEEQTSVRTLALDYGLQYTKPLGKYDIGVGLTYAASTNFNTRTESYSYTTNNNGQPIDSIENIIEGSTKYPSNFGVGLLIGKRVNNYVTAGWSATSKYAWSLTADLETFQGADFISASGENPYNNSWRAELGWRIIPSQMNQEISRKRSYLSHVEYRVGGYYEETPIQINDFTLPDYGITFGLGLPIKQTLGPGENRRSIVNAGVILGRRGSLDQGIIRESYFKVFVGITFNDKWFIDYKYR